MNTWPEIGQRKSVGITLVLASTTSTNSVLTVSYVTISLFFTTIRPIGARRFQSKHLLLFLPRCGFFHDYYNNHLCLQDLEKYYKAMDAAIIRYHSDKMQEINSILRGYWRRVYLSGDIDYIEIKSEVWCFDGNKHRFTESSNKTRVEEL